MAMNVLVTGASGFVGKALCSALLAEGVSVRAAVRSSNSISAIAGLQVAAVGEIGAQTDWSAALADVDCVIHCAARAHVMQETEADALAAYREVNVAGTQRLAEQAAAMGVRRLVYLSSIKVNGEQTALGAPFLFSDAPAPEDPYGVSKWEAEQALWAVSARTGLEVVVVRPPLVYGPGAKGNLLRLASLVARGLPLPLGAVQNQRSLVGSLQVDSGYTQAQLGWAPPVSVADGVREMARWYARSQDTQA
jgi:nucleoside-diphosphate-sugar epimerase